MNKEKKTILVTGCAGFIGFHISLYFLKLNYHVIGVDNLNDYYDIKLKKDRLRELKKTSTKEKKKFNFFSYDLREYKKIQFLFTKYKFKKVIHLAAQAGVRYSLKNPRAYLNSNIIGFFNILECSKKNKITKLIFASSSSVYGNLNKIKFKENDSTDHPIQFYAATKKSNEVMAHAYSQLYKMNIFGLRFFTVYGPWGRPDMSYYKFTKNIIKNKKIDIYNMGNHKRDFTYIDDVCEIIGKLTTLPEKKLRNFKIFNVGSSKPHKLIRMIDTLESILRKKSKRNYLGLQKGDVQKTFSDSSLIKKYVKIRSKTSLSHGLSQFVNWYKKYNRIK